MHLRRLEENRRTLRTAYRVARRGRAAGRAGRAGDRVAARQLPRHRLGGPRHRPRPAAVVLPAAADDRCGRVRGLSPHLRARTRADPLERGAPRRARLSRFITAFQSVTPLTIGELWAWPSMLKLALVEHLRVRADVLSAARVHRQHADRIVCFARPRRRTAPSSGPTTRIPPSSPACCSASANTASAPRRCSAS